MAELDLIPMLVLSILTAASSLLNFADGHLLDRRLSDQRLRVRHSAGLRESTVRLVVVVERERSGQSAVDRTGRPGGLAVEGRGHARELRFER